MNGESRDNEGRLTDIHRATFINETTEHETSKSYHMKPVYEGYFYTIHWVADNKNPDGNYFNHT